MQRDPVQPNYDWSIRLVENPTAPKDLQICLAKWAG
jgi:hypothetical protein